LNTDSRPEGVVITEMGTRNGGSRDRIPGEQLGKPGEWYPKTSNEDAKAASLSGLASLVPRFLPEKKGSPLPRT